jgi:glycosyltransferase involved in cell wall biosynthesis
MYFPLVRNKMQLIPIGIESPVFMSVDGAKQLLSKKVNMDLSLFKKKTVMGTISELHNNKGLHYLVESMESVVKKHKDAIMVVIGEGEQRESLTEHIKKSGLEKNFFLVGYIDHANEYLKALDIFVFPSIKEGLPYALLEAGMASLPVISTTVGGIPDIIEDMKTGILIQPKNTRDLTHAISFMLEHPKDIKRYGKSLKEQVSTKFSSIKMLENIDKLFSEAYKPKNQ